MTDGITQSDINELRKNRILPGKKKEPLFRFRVEIFYNGSWSWVEQPFGFGTSKSKPEYDNYQDAATQCDHIRRGWPKKFGKPNVRVVIA